MKSKRYQFGDCLVNCESRELIVSGQKVDIQPKVFRLIEYLIDNRTRIVTKEELQEQVWEGSYITDTALTRAIMKARKAIGDDAQNQSLIKTIHGEGYRFIAGVELHTDSPSPIVSKSSRPEPRIRKGKLQWRYYAIVVLLFVGLYAGIMLQQKGSNQPLRLAILPFEVTADSEEFEWVSLGLMSLVSQQISKEMNIPVVSSRRILSTQDQLADQGSDSNTISKQFRDLLNEIDGATHFVKYQLTTTGQGLQLNYLITDITGKAIASDQFSGEKPTVLARASILSVAESLGVTAPVEKIERVISEDAFLNETYSRGLALQLSGKAEEALNYFKIASDMEPQLFWPRYEYAIAQRIVGNNEIAEKILVELEPRAENLEQQISIANALGLLYWRLSKMDKAKSYLESGLALAQETGFIEQHAILLGNLAILAKNESEFEKSRTYLGKALSLYQELGTTTPPGWLSNTLAGLYVNEGNFTEAEIHFEQAISYFRKVQNERNLASSLSGYSSALIKTGEYDKAELLQNESLALRNKINDQRGIASSIINLADLHMSKGQFSAASEQLKSLEQTEIYTKSSPIQLAALRRQAHLSFEKQQYQKGLESLDKAEEIAVAVNRQLTISNIHMLRLEILIGEGIQQDILSQLDALMGKLELNGYTRLMIKGYKLKAELAQKNNQPEVAISHYKEAIGHANTIRDRLGRARAEIDLAQLYLDQNDMESAESLIALLSAEFDYLYKVKILRAKYADLSDDKVRTLEHLQQAKAIANERWTEEYEIWLQAITTAI